MPQITPEQWTNLENNLCTSFSAARLKCDGYDLTLEVRRVKGLRLAIVPFVGGTFSGAWLMADCEERRRFLCPCQIKPRKRDLDINKMVRRVDRILKRPPTPAPRPITYYRGYWTSFKRLKAHLVRHNTTIELVSTCPF